MAQTIQPAQLLDLEKLRAEFKKSLNEHWLLYFIEAIVLIVLGVLAVVVPPLASLAVEIFVGWLLLVGGGVGFITTFVGHKMPGFWWSLVSAALAVGVGAMLIWSPLRGILSLTLVLAVFFVVEGIASIMFAIEHRRQASHSWGWLVVSGVIDLALAGFIISGFPGTAAWAIGLIVGVDFIFGGSSLMVMALRARRTIS